MHKSKSKAFEKSYNERLFGKGLRKKLHMGRFNWLNEQMERLDCLDGTMLELGCFDAKTLDFLPVKPTYYRGYDANWEHGLEIGREKWKNDSSVELFECQTASEMDVKESSFDVSVSLETFEHIPTTEVDAYVEKLAFATKKYCFIAVPNEKGIVFLTKHLVKKMMNNHQEDYTLPEYLYATLGQLNKVERHEGGHKGFDYANLFGIVNKHFRKVELMGIPFNNLPTSLNFSAGIIGIK